MYVNITDNVQIIHYIDGSCHRVEPLGTVGKEHLDEKKMYSHEIERLSQFLKFKKDDEKKPDGNDKGSGNKTGKDNTKDQGKKSSSNTGGNS